MAGNKVVRIALRGESILTNPRWNKGTAFTMRERKQLGIVGRLPYQVNSLNDQCRRAYDQLLSRDTPLRKNSFLQSLKEQNLVLFYQLLRRHLKELMPIVYTPTEVHMHPILLFLHSQSKYGTGRCNRELFALIQAERRFISHVR
jgi:malate dehydrogenase (oxaloacetate-decarboxylating)